jgi:hypothetical protein
LEIRPLAELQEPDKMTLRFGPMGLETGRMLVADDAALYRQEVISGADLVPAAAASTRRTFERLRSTYAYGILSYEIFTVVHDLVQLVIEQALRDRFMEFHHGVVCFQDTAGAVHEIRERTFDELHDALHSENRLRRPQSWRLPLRRTGELIYFDGMLHSLFRWARGEGLLRGQRNRRLEPLLKTTRNYVAHGSGDHLVTPVDTARDINDAAEIINQLWGSATPGGRLFPAPIRREVQSSHGARPAAFWQDLSATDCRPISIPAGVAHSCRRCSTTIAWTGSTRYSKRPCTQPSCSADRAAGLMPRLG